MDVYGGLLEQMLSTQREYLGFVSWCVSSLFLFRIQKKGKEKKINRGRSNFFWVGDGGNFFRLGFFFDAEFDSGCHYIIYTHSKCCTVKPAFLTIYTQQFVFLFE